MAYSLNACKNIKCLFKQPRRNVNVMLYRALIEKSCSLQGADAVTFSKTSRLFEELSSLFQSVWYFLDLLKKDKAVLD